MSDEREPTTPDDPFLAEDPEAYERERRRLQREAKRQERSSSRRSLSDRVSGALDGAADKGRDAIEQTKERVARPEASSDAAGAEPPSFRRSSSDSGRVSADVLMPERPARQRQPAVGDSSGPVTGEYPRLPPPTSPPPGAHTGTILRLIIAAGGVLLLALGAFLLLSGRDDPPPVSSAEGRATLKTKDLTIPEGYTRTQIAEVAKDAGLKGDYVKETASPPKGFDITKEGAPADASLEGFLFPSTYNLEQGSSVAKLIEEQLVAFNDNIAEVDLAGAKKKNLTLYDVVIIASMIEREVLVPEERPIVAAVIYNRLSQGIPLGIDATLRYDLDNFDKALTESDLATDSPYNTRLVQGLPPTPIANPGLDSLEAAANPSNDDYLYYVGKYGTCGEHYFTSDYDEFLAASDKYNAALEAEGGSPTEC